MNEPTLFVVIPTRDRRTMLRACLSDLMGQREALPLEVLVVDDASSDGTADMLASEFPQVTVLSGDGDLWWAGATNKGLDRVLDRAQEGDFVLTLNDDTRVGPTYVRDLVASSERIGTGCLVGTVAVDSASPDTIVDGGVRIRWGSARYVALHAGEALSAVLASGIQDEEVDVLPGRGTLIPVDVLRHVGVFAAARFPHYGADYEFSRRAAREGSRLHVTYETHLLSVVEATGVRSGARRMSWGEFARSYFDRRSPSCLLYRWRFATVGPPLGWRPTFLVLDTARAVVGGIRDQVRWRRA